MTKISSSTDFFNSMYTPCIRIKSSRKRIDINGFKKLLVTPNFVLICLSTAFWYSFCCRIESYPNVQHVCQPKTRSNRLILIHQMKLSVTTSFSIAHFTFPTDWSSAVAIAAKTRRSSSWMLSLNLLIRSFGAWSGWCAFALWTASCARYKKSGLEVLCELIKFTAWSVNI